MMPTPDPDPRPGAPAGTAAGAAPRRRERTCVGCRTATDPEQIVRLILAPDGAVVPDLGRRAHGRGAWVHPRPDCLRDAVRRGLARSFGAPVTTSLEELLALLRAAADRRAAALLSSAWRARRLELGADAVAAALAERAAVLVVVAADARAAAETPGLDGAIAAGLARVWGTKADLGRAVGREEVGVVAVLDAGLGRALSTALELAQMPAPAAQPNRTAPGGSTEDG